VAAPRRSKALVPRIDSSALRQATARPESSAPAETPESSDIASVRRSVDPFVFAARSGDASKVAQAAPFLSKAQISFYKDLFQRAEHLSAGAQKGLPQVNGDRATMAFTLNLRYDDKNSKQPMVVPVRYEGTFERKDGRWQLVELRTRG
jgi:hypothetical protein